MRNFIEAFIFIFVGLSIGMVVVTYQGGRDNRLETCEENLELLSEVYCQQLKVLKYSGSENELVIEIITEEEENPVCNY